MGGCTNCKGKAGCDDHKGQMMGTVEQALADLYPTRTWGEAHDTEAVGLDDEELAGLAEELAVELKAATFIRHGGDDEACDYIYILSLGRTPCVVQVRDHGVEPPDEWRTTRSGAGGDAEVINELYMRVVISHRARVAAVQQVAINLVRTDDGYVIHERPRAGVYDAPLLKRLQKLVAILPAYDLVHLDFGDIAHAPPGFSAGEWRALYGADPSIANYLFYAQPTTMISTTYVPAGETS
jgi:hypothetical protein